MAKTPSPEWRLIEGKEPDSIEECRVATALERWKIPYDYQYNIGISGTRGSIWVDFVAYIPWKQPIEIFGSYWHAGELGSEDRLVLSREAQFFGREPVLIFGEEIPDQDAANQVIRNKLLL